MSFDQIGKIGKECTYLIPPIQYDESLLHQL